MKPFSWNWKPFLLGGALVLTHDAAFSQSLGSAAPPQPAQVRVRIDLLNVTSLDQQEILGADEFFALWVFSEMRVGAHDSRPWRGPTHFGVSQPVSVARGERKNIWNGQRVFEGVLSEREALSGTLRAMEEDETRTWNDTTRAALSAEVLERIESEKNMRESTVNSDARAATSEDLANWMKTWWNRAVPRPNAHPFEDHDDIIADTPLEIAATGAPSEDRMWRAQGDGAVYELRYRITRTPISPQTNPKPLPRPTIPTPPAPPTTNLSGWEGVWHTTNGRVNLVLENGVLRGQLFLQMADGSDKEWDHLELRAGGTPGQLVGTAKTGTLVTQVALSLAPDGQSFTATGQVPNQPAYKWSGKRNRVIAKTDAVPATSPITETFPKENEAPTPNPLPTVQISPAPATPTGSSSAFLPLRSFEVRVDRVAPSITGDKLEVDCTFKNRTAIADNINGSMISVVVTDADGMGYLGGGFYRPSRDAELMAGNREVATQGELKARLLIDIAPGTAPLRTLTLWETTSQPQTVDISNVQWPGARPAANLSALKLNGATPEFQACGEGLDVRFDGFRKARSGFYEAFFTFKNLSDTRTRSAVLDFHRGSFDVFTLGEDGAKASFQQLARAGGESATPIVTHYAILPGGETRLRYTFSSKDDVPNPVKVSFTDRRSQTTLEWSVSAK